MFTFDNYNEVQFIPNKKLISLLKGVNVVLKGNSAIKRVKQLTLDKKMFSSENKSFTQ